jgi:hypothetical protein
MSALGERLRHDVAKYLTRAARNLGAAPISPALAALLARDLYEAPGGGRPSARFAELAAAVDEAAARRVGALFERLDALEPAVRARTEDAMRAAAALALEIAAAIEQATARGRA